VSKPTEKAYFISFNPPPIEETQPKPIWVSRANLSKLAMNGSCGSIRMI